MKIGELACHSGLAPSRIRFYEARGLIRAERLANGYRQYATDTVQRLDIITGAQRAGFALDEIRELMPVGGEKKWRRTEMLAALRQKIAEIEAMQQRLHDSGRSCSRSSARSRANRRSRAAIATPTPTA